MNKQIQKYKEQIKTINSWLKFFWTTNTIFLLGNIILLKLITNISLTPAILLFSGTALATVYMSVIKSNTKRKIQHLKLKQENFKKINNNESNINSKKITKTNTLTNKNNYYYKNNFKNLSPQNKNPKIKKRIFPN